MSSAPRPVPRAPSHRLIAHAGPDEVVAWRLGERVTARRFLADVAAVAASLPDARHVLNFFADRYRFAVMLGAAIVRRQVTLLPPTTTPHVIASMKAFAPDAYFVTDDPAIDVSLPCHVAPEPLGGEPGAFEVPEVPADQRVACVFTSGSTGEPQPNFKHWGPLVADLAAEMRRLGIGPGHVILGTVPAQHMYGFESTVLLPLLSGAALTAERLFFPADIDAALAHTPAPRILFTTPFHLRAWVDGMEPPHGSRLETIVSATAPLSVELARRAEQRTGAELFEIYGCTEAGQIATRRTTRGPEWRLLDDLKLWKVGEQAMVSGGHVERPTALGDLIELAGDGARFVLHGRSADMVNIAGKRNSLGYLNHQLGAIEGVEDGAFFMPDDAELDGVTRLAAFAVAPGLDAAHILAQLRSRIDPAFLPRPLVIVDRLPRQLTGKLSRESLLALARANGIGPSRRG